ncbi:hypothetical protein G7Z17_g12419 [Cylindrodendrum hubeiense]|uniref:Uncharacterized protein n=1 Tax=Cylindrodendrum hubeiense TaxID=595255 RepID=A0A9P5GXQ8_9HYPO|nr:hypothetical protein G7Z17_g12419 [Cylindrodendrum hubeiense]
MDVISLSTANPVGLASINPQAHGNAGPTAAPRVQDWALSLDGLGGQGEHGKQGQQQGAGRVTVCGASIRGPRVVETSGGAAATSTNPQGQIQPGRGQTEGEKKPPSLGRSRLCRGRVLCCAPLAAKGPQRPQRCGRPRYMRRTTALSFRAGHRLGGHPGASRAAPALSFARFPGPQDPRRRQASSPPKNLVRHLGWDMYDVVVAPCMLRTQEEEEEDPLAYSTGVA